MIVNLGGGHYLADTEIQAIIKAGLSSAAQLCEKNKGTRMYISLSGRQKVRSLIMTKEYIFASNVAPETIVKRMQTPCTDTEESDT